MSDKKLPIDLTEPHDPKTPRFVATALLREGEKAGGERDYLLRWATNSHELAGDVVIVCNSELQLHLVHRGMTLDDKDRENQEIGAIWGCEKIIGEIMSRRIYEDDFYDSGRNHLGYKLVWLRKKALKEIERALERAEEHGLAALVREATVKDLP